MEVIIQGILNQVQLYYKGVTRYVLDHPIPGSDDDDDDSVSSGSASCWSDDGTGYLKNTRRKGKKNVDLTPDDIETYVKALVNYDVTSMFCPCGNNVDDWRKKNDLWWIKGPTEEHFCGSKARNNLEDLMRHCKDICKQRNCPLHFAFALFLHEKAKITIPTDLRQHADERTTYKSLE